MTMPTIDSRVASEYCSVIQAELREEDAAIDRVEAYLEGIEHLLLEREMRLWR